jgi:hypothetical protein
VLFMVVEERHVHRTPLAIPENAAHRPTRTF